MSKSLLHKIKLFFIQLSQVQIALSATPKGPDKDNLLSLQSDILEVIQLTKERLGSLPSVGNSSEKSASNEPNDDPLAREYALFQVNNKCEFH